MRVTNFLNKPMDEWQAVVEALGGTTFFLVSRPGPAVFIVKDEGDNTFRVTLGDPHRCTCGVVGCIHTAYAVIKVLKVPKEHQLSYQLGLTDNELDMMLSGQFRPRVRPKIVRPLRSQATPPPEDPQPVQQPPLEPQAQATSPKKKVETCGAIVRKEVSGDEEEPCTICQDEMSAAQALTWCRHGCGNNFHAACMMKFAQHKESRDQQASCPLCRELWDMALLRLDCQRSKPVSSVPCVPINCTNCTSLMRGLFHRCVECSQRAYMATGSHVDYCVSCFPRLGDRHRGHHFLTSDASIQALHEVTWMPAKHPMDAEVSQRSRAEQLAVLQHRDLTATDYDLLLRLDQHQHHGDTVSSVLIGSMTEVSAETVGSNPVRHGRCWCNGDPSPSMLLLPCGHVTHGQCLREEVDTMAATDLSSLADYRCPKEGCGKLVFGALRRRKRRPKPLRPKAQPADVSLDLSLPQQSQPLARSGVLRGIGQVDRGQSFSGWQGLSGSALLSLPQISNNSANLASLTSRSAASSSTSSDIPPQRSTLRIPTRRHTAHTLSTGPALSVGALRPMIAEEQGQPGLMGSSMAMAAPLPELRNRPPKRLPRGIGTMRSAALRMNPSSSSLIRLEAVHLGHSPAQDALFEIEPSPSLLWRPVPRAAAVVPSDPVIPTSIGDLQITSTSFSRSTSQLEVLANASQFGSGAVRQRDPTPPRRPPMLRPSLSGLRRSALDGGGMDGGDSLNQLINVVHYR